MKKILDFKSKKENEIQTKLNNFLNGAVTEFKKMNNLSEDYNFKTAQEFAEYFFTSYSENKILVFNTIEEVDSAISLLVKSKYVDDISYLSTEQIFTESGICFKINPHFKSEELIVELDDDFKNSLKMNSINIELENKIRNNDIIVLI